MLKLKKWIKMLIIILSIIIISIIIYVSYRNRGSLIYGIDEQGKDVTYNLDTTIQPVTVRNDFYIVKTCVNKFYTYYSEIYNLIDNNYIIDEEALASIADIQKENVEAIYNMLDTEYIKFKGLTKENITTNLQEINTVIVNINNMYVSERTENISLYIVNGTLREKVSGDISEFKIMVKLDALKRTFTIFLEDYIDENYPELKIGDNIEIEVEKNIEEKIYNVYEYESISDETYVTDLFNKYKEEILYNTELAYEHLNDEYRKNRFETLESFKKYAKNNVIKNVTMEIKRYTKIESDEYKQYVCVDQEGNYYIFTETSIMQYDLMLDEYTLDLPEFIDKYKNAKEEIKVGMNVEKIKQALNQKDYQYIYKKLDDEFKQTNFSTFQNFEIYMSQKYPSTYEIDYLELSKEGEIYLQPIILKDQFDRSQIENTIIMQLKEGTDFVMSFGIE